MQIDRWPTHIEQDYEDPTEEAAHNPIRRRASVWIDPPVQRNISASPRSLKEQRVIPNPRTPIPARASAHPTRKQGKARYSIPQQSDVTRIPTTPPTSPLWQDEAQDFVAESSVDALSLSFSRHKAIAIDKLDTIPPPRSPTLDELDTVPQLSPALDELDTLPPQLSPTLDRQNTVPPQLSPALDELITQPPQKKKTPAARKDTVLFESRHSPMTMAAPATVEGVLQKDGSEGVSWTTAQGKDSWLAQRVASKKRDGKKNRKSSRSFNPVDSLRWWLLYPGRIEFLLWLNGAIVLVTITFLLLFATTLSMGWLNIGSATSNNTHGTLNTAGSVHKPAPAQTPCTVTNAQKPQCRSTTVSSSGLQLMLVDNNTLFASTPIYLHGRGFSTGGTVALTYDAQLPCRPNITQTNAQGTFSTSLLFGVDVKAGRHKIVALDMASSHSVNVMVDIAATQAGGTGSLPYGQPGSGVTTGQGGAPKPGGQTPVPVVPTSAVAPTSVPTQVPTPTASVSPSPTVGTTTTPTTGKKQTDPYLALRSTLYNESADGHFSITPWLWVAIIGYMLSMTMLGLAGLLYRRKRRLPSR